MSVIKKRLIRITFVDGTVDEQEIKTQPQHFRLPANDMGYVQLCQQAFALGFVNLDAGPNYMKWISPSQIKFIEIIFEDVQPAKTTLKIEKP